MGLIITLAPGYSDLQDSVLAAGSPAIGIEIAKIYTNSVFGKERIEVFQAHYKNGDTIPLPVSDHDGYAYSRNELIYLWAVESTAELTSGWMTGQDSLWYCEWRVDQATGIVYCDEWYRRSGSHYHPEHTNDGVLRVFTIAQRQFSNIVMAASPSYSAITAGWIAQDKPLTQQLAQGLNDDAKFSVVNREVFYLGEFYNGETVPMPISPADGYHYSSSECKFQFSWRWTPLGNSATLVQPLVSLGQLGPMQAAVSSVGVVSTNVEYVTDGLVGGTTITNMNTHGRIAVFAFCTRSGTPSGITLSGFQEISYDNFMPGQPLPSGIVSTIVNDINEALGTPEFFGPTIYKDGDVIPLPTSVFDPTYTYTRNELHYIYELSDTTNQTGSNLRVPIWYTDISSTGVVKVNVWRLPPGGPTVDDNNTLGRIRVMVVAWRQANPPSSIAPVNANQSASSAASVGTQDVPTLSTAQHDQFSGNGSTTVFTLSAAPGSAVALVFWNGNYQRPSKYTISGTTFTTLFTDAGGTAHPADTGDTIDVIYFT